MCCILLKLSAFILQDVESIVGCILYCVVSGWLPAFYILYCVVSGWLPAFYILYCVVSWWLPVFCIVWFQGGYRYSVFCIVWFQGGYRYFRVTCFLCLQKSKWRQTGSCEIVILFLMSGIFIRFVTPKRGTGQPQSAIRPSFRPIL